jgi:YfiH family protein
VKQSNSSQKAPPDLHLKAIDALFERAGLVRKRRGTPAGITTQLRRLRMDRTTPEELSVPSAPPHVAKNGVEWLPVPGWEKYGTAKSGWLWHGFSTRRGGASRAYCCEDAPGELNLGFTADDSWETVVQNRRLLAEAVTGTPSTPLVALRQFHSNLVVRVSAKDARRDPSPNPGVPGDRSLSQGCKADGLMTDEPGILLAIQTADCIPVVVADRKRRAVAAFHAGWRGTVKRIVELGIGRMRFEFGSQPEDLIAAIGPGVGACCYAVGEEVLSSFESQFAYARGLFREVYDSDPVRTKYPMLFLTQRAPGHSPIGPALHLDLVEANRRQLIDAGLKPSAVKTVGGCTSCQPELFFSHRASHGHAGRMFGVIGIRSHTKSSRQG